MSSPADECAAERSYREAYGRNFSQGVRLKQVGAAPQFSQQSEFTSGTVDVQRVSYAQAATTSGQEGALDATVLRKMQMSESGIIATLRTIREPIVDYQENRGVLRDEQISFVTLITSLCTQAYTAAITILVMLWNLAPLLDGFVYFARFFLDKLIEILETSDQKERAIKAVVFFGEILVILLIIFLIMGLIFMPVYVLTARIVGKIWGMIAW